MAHKKVGKLGGWDVVVRRAARHALQDMLAVLALVMFLVVLWLNGGGTL